MFKYAGVIINNESSKVDRPFTYSIDKNMQEYTKIGQRVKIPFGRGNKIVDGFIIELFNDCEFKNLKGILEICDDFTVFREKDIELIKVMRQKYLCTYLDCIKLLIPKGIMKGMKHKLNKIVSIKSPLSGKYANDNYNNIFSIVKNNNGVYTKNQLSNVFNVSLSSINTLINHGFLDCDVKVVDRINNREYEKYGEKVLNISQKAAVDEIIRGENRNFLIHGITGSGKTEIYMKLVSLMLEENKESIILVPEIALTPQMLERFKGRFGKDIAVFHSKLSDGERYDEWLRVKEGRAKVAVGARSALFLPFSNLGLIVIDEEHEASYKSDVTPKYSAVELAQIKCRMENCKLVLGSATPSIDTYYKCMQGSIKLINLNERADGAQLPDVHIVDMKNELMNNNKSMFSRKLYDLIEDKLKKKEQIILFLNRRGFSTFVSCRKCGYVFKCDHCDIAMTYHSKSRKLVCHYCGSTKELPSVCPNCKSRYVKYFGVGTEKIEQEVLKCFPSARTLRMDHDTTRAKNSYEKIYNKFKNGEADVLIGTQMIAKGLDFKNVTLVGVIAADLSLNLPDYRANERTFQLINQVSGRAGRGAKKGEVVIQTYSPESSAIIAASKNDYEGFYNEEIQIRKLMDYPPFKRILSINLSSQNENLLIKNTQNVGVLLKNKFLKSSNIKILGPCPCIISKIKEMYRWQIILKGDFDNEFAEKIKKVVYESLKNDYNSIRISIDINPTNLL
ncbi:MAG: primosomal protein N' [Clostridium sp.]|nr:primosomal protein N' [Clostridium sp.]